MSITYNATGSDTGGPALIQNNEATKNITGVASITDGIRVTTSAAHGYAIGDLIEHAGTTDYNGAWFVSDVPTTTTYDITNQVFWDDEPLVYTSSQTGTAARGDKDLSNASGKTGVTVTTEGIYQKYNFGTLQFITNGAIAIAQNDTPEILEIDGLTTNDWSMLKIVDGYFYVGDVMKTDNDMPFYNLGVTAIRTKGDITDNPTSFSNGGTSAGYVTGRHPGISVQNTSTMVARFCNISDYTGFGVVDSGRLACEEVVLGSHDFRPYTTTVRIKNSKVLNSGGYFQNYALFDGVSFLPNGVNKAYFNISSTTGAITATVRNIPDLPYQYIAGWASENMPIYNCINPYKGSDYVATNRNTTDTSEAPDIRGWDIYLKKEVNTLITNAGSGLSGVKLRITGKSGQTYDVTTTTGGVLSAEEEILLAYFTNPNDSTAISYTFYSKNNDNTDLFDFKSYAYLYNSVETTEILKGNNSLVWTQPLPNDQLITQTNDATVAAYTTHDDAREGYDGAKLIHYTNRIPLIIGRAGAQLDFDGGTATSLVVDSAAAASKDYTGTTYTLKSSVFTGGATGTGAVTIQGATELNGGTFDNSAGVVYGSSETILTDVTANLIDFTIAGTYTIDGCTIGEVTNSSGGSIILNLTNGASITTNTGPSITVNAATATLNFSNLTDATVEIFNDSGVSQQRYTAQTGTLQYNTPAATTGTWTYVVDRIGYVPLRGSYNTTGDNVAINGALNQLITVTGEVMYTGTTSADITVAFDFITPCLCIEIGNAIVDPQTVFDEVELSLVTADGMRWQNTYGTLVRFAGLPNLGNSLFFESNIRLKRALAGDVNAAVAGYVSSVDGIVVDGTNGSVGYSFGLSIEDFWEYASRSLTTPSDYQAKATVAL